MAFVFVWAGLFFWENREAFKVFERVPLYYWSLPIFLYICTIYVKGLSFDIIAMVFNRRIGFFDTIALTSSSLLSNYALPGNSGIAFRVIYMQRVLGLSYKSYLPILLIAFLFSTALYGISAGIAAFAHGGFNTEAPRFLIVIFSSGSLLVIGFLLAIVPLSKLAIFKNSKIDLILHGWVQFIHSKKLLAYWFVIEALRAALEIAIYYIIAVELLGMNLSVLQVAVIVFIKECSMFFRITPGALGVAEGVQVFFAIAYGVSPVDIVLVSVAYRVIEIGCLVIFTAIFVPALKKKLFHKEEISENP